MPITAVIISKNGSTSTANITENFAEDLYKKCGFKTSNGFRCVHTWSLTFNNIIYELRVYGKTTGRAGSENTYEFPPPIDKTLFFSKCAVVNTVDNKPVNLSAKEFEDIMEFLHGGFEDIDDSDTATGSTDEDTDDVKSLTKDGYEKDGFVVDDDEVDEEEEEKKKPKQKKAKAPAKSKKNAEPVYYEYGDELCEEDYV
jgi:hypothetical protein